MLCCHSLYRATQFSKIKLNHPRARAGGRCDAMSCMTDVMRHAALLDGRPPLRALCMHYTYQMRRDCATRGLSARMPRENFCPLGQLGLERSARFLSELAFASGPARAPRCLSGATQQHKSLHRQRHRRTKRSSSTEKWLDAFPRLSSNISSLSSRPWLRCGGT